MFLNFTKQISICRMEVCKNKDSELYILYLFLNKFCVDACEIIYWRKCMSMATSESTLLFPLDLIGLLSSHLPSGRLSSLSS